MEERFDVVIAGSGAAGMTAALAAAEVGLRAVVVEKAAHFGGSTARSGGGVWIPGNEVLRAGPATADDTAEQARDYLLAITSGTVPADLVDAFLAHGPDVVSLVHRRTPLRLQWVPHYADYHPEAPGGRIAGRSVEPRTLDGRVLGAELANLEPPYSKPPAGVPISQADYRWLSLLARHPRGWAHLASLGGRWAYGRLVGQRPLSMGQALAAGLRAGLATAGVPVLLDTAMLEPTVEDGRVTGLRVRRPDGSEVVLVARYGVLLACGGFEHNAAMRAEHQRAPIGTEWTVGAAANTGDGILAGQRLGADTALLDEAWWGPTFPLPGGPWFALAERSRPCSLMVNGSGQRFVNESAPYVEAVHAMYGEGNGPAANLPCWLVFDQRYRERYMFTGVAPRQRLPRRWQASGVLRVADTLDGLAAAIEVPADALAATVARFNGFAASGVDSDFGRGTSGYDNYYGDPRNHPNPNLGPVGKPPFHAIRMVPGDLGTKGGLRTDAHARVLRADGSAIPGLYAAGNTATSVMGRTYAGPGATIGPAMVFGSLAVRHMAARAGEPEPASGREGGRR